MIRQLIVLMTLFLVGCHTHPRYRTGGEESPPQINQANVKQTTNDYIRLGQIMQAYLGKPYSGRSKWEQGFDCSHFTATVFKRYGNTPLPRTVAEQFKAGRAAHFRQLQYGDLVFFKTERNQISHVGIYIGESRFIHASTSSGVIVSGMDESYWAKRFAGARRILD